MWNTSSLIPDYWEDTKLTPQDTAEEEARSEGVVLNALKAKQTVKAMIDRNLFLWVEGQDLHEEETSVGF